MTTTVLDRIVEQNLGVYRAAPSRLQEDLSQEAQVANDYRGRLIYELLQNADDAMEGEETHDDRICFLITDNELWVANSGRALTDSDIQGLCGLGASSKIDVHGTRRASIGHKGLGFKSVLEITQRPVVYSTPHSFELGQDHALRYLADLWSEWYEPPPKAAPAMRFPVAADPTDEVWSGFAAEGFKTAFRFPFRTHLSTEQRRALADRLAAIPLTTVLFLKHLERVEVRVEQQGFTTSKRWDVTREKQTGDGQWSLTPGLIDSGIYRVRVRSDADEAATFVVAHDADVSIGANRTGLSGPAWEGVDLTEVAVAVLARGSEHVVVPESWRYFHVFLPTQQRCPYPFIVNGAFTTDLSRQQVRVSSEPHDYNAHLVNTAAKLYAEKLVPVLLEHGPFSVLETLERTDRTDGGHDASAMLHASLSAALAQIPLLPLESGRLVPIANSVMPPVYLDDQGAAYRRLLRPEALHDGHWLPSADFCAGRWARIAADHGARELRPAESLSALATLLDPEGSAFIEHASGGFEVDPVLEICTALLQRVEPEDRDGVVAQARQEALFPVGQSDDGTPIRVALGIQKAFYPPRSAHFDLPLSGLRFMCHSLCWGALTPPERTTFLGDQMMSWSALFDVHDFRFEEVMREGVTPALVLNPDEQASRMKHDLQSIAALATICQLAGSFVKPDRPLRFQRLQSDRAQFRLSRLPVPCRTLDGEKKWLPAYRVYFGRDWLGDDSVEDLFDAARTIGSVDFDCAFLAPPEEFIGQLLQYNSQDESASDLDSTDDDVSTDEDTDQALESTERNRWVAFLSWIGVNRSLRLIHFHDVEDDNTGWLTTKGIRQPQGQAFRNLGSTWDDYSRHLHAWFNARPDSDDVNPFLYEAHDLDHAFELLQAVEQDRTTEIAKRLLEHLVRNWDSYASHTRTRVALVTKGKWPGNRRPPRALTEELHDVGDNVWLCRLKSRSVCPTTQGPRSGDITWAPSKELERRLGRSGRSAGQLLPVLDLPTGLPSSSVRALADRLGIRAELSPSVFGLDDARQLCDNLRRLYVKDNPVPLDRTQLRTVVKPVYRQLFELLSGQSGDAEQQGLLGDVELLADTPEGMQFLPASAILYASTPGIRERSGVAGRLPLFVLEAESGATKPLTALFSAQLLEDVLEWTADWVTSEFKPPEIATIRGKLAELLPPLLARIRAERSDPRDRRLLTELLTQIQPVEELHLSCTVHGSSFDPATNRSYYVRQPTGDQPMQALIVWKGSVWPPLPETAQDLAMAIADTLGINLVETFLAFIQSDSHQRSRLLDIAGASNFVEEIADELRDLGEQRPPEPKVHDPEDLRTAASTSGPSDEAPATTPTPSPPAAPPIPLLRFEDLTVEGEPITVFGENRAHDSAGTGGTGSGSAGTGSSPGLAGLRAAPGTDLNALDELGMRIAMTYELGRLGRGGLAPIMLDTAIPDTGARTLVVDVHTPALIKAAEESSQVVAAIFKDLESKGIGRLFPGFDILTICDGRFDRLIELKSSGIDARVQAMSWNEWKSAQNSEARSAFWLYLVGNLRADLHHAHPYLRAIRDPFGTLVGQEVEDHQVRRAVQLRVTEFKEAEQLRIGVTGKGE
ncbi:MAG: DUF3883 domain-containing protein [Actinomycetes bacterium]